MPAKLPIARNTMLLSAGMAALYGMVQLWAAVTPITFEAVTGLEGLVGLGPAIFMSTAALAALPAGRAMDRFGRVPVLAGGFALGILGCALAGLGASLLSAVAVFFGLVLIGASYGTVMLSRTAAADMYPPERRAKGIALVLFGAVFGAILGPFVFVPLFAEEEAQGGRLMMPWLAAAGFMALGLVLMLNVRPDPKRIGGVLAPSSAGDITWTPPQLRREIYEAVDLRVTVDPDGGMRAEARVDEATIRVSREAERYARAIREAERRLERRVHEDPPAERSEDLERAELELVRVRRELSSPIVTDAVIAVVAGE